MNLITVEQIKEWSKGHFFTISHKLDFNNPTGLKEEKYSLYVRPEHPSVKILITKKPNEYKYGFIFIAPTLEEAFENLKNELKKIENPLAVAVELNLAAKQKEKVSTYIERKGGTEI